MGIRASTVIRKVQEINWEMQINEGVFSKNLTVHLYSKGENDRAEGEKRMRVNFGSVGQWRSQNPFPSI